MDDSDPASNRRGLLKRKYNHGPVMRVEKQFRNTEGSSYQVLFGQTTTRTQHAQHHDASNCPPSSSVHKPGPSARVNNRHVFVVHTSSSMSKGESPKSARSSDHPPMPSNEKLPAGKRPRLNGVLQPDRKYILRPTRPVKNSDQVDFDIWAQILGYCDPKLLAVAKTINSSFYRLLSDRSTIWRDSRLNYYGLDMPDCPRGLTEQRYVDLLTGRGCQNRLCPKEHTTRVYWTFQVRLCAECFKQKTMRADDLPPHRRHVLPLSTDEDSPENEPELWELLPLARIDGRRYLRPRPVDTNANRYARSYSSRPYVFLKSSYLQLEAEYLKRVRSGGDNAIKQWVNGIHDKTMAFMIEAAELEFWYKQQASAVEPDFQDARVDYFLSRAAELSPPISKEAMWKMAAFRRILKVPNPPTARSWKTLKAKILPYQSQAEQVVDFDRQMSVSLVCPSSKIILFQRLHEHRCGRKQQPRCLKPEQEFVLCLGRTQFNQCLRDGVADEDLLLLCLKRVYDTYNLLDDRPIGLNYDGTTGPYRLSLDDARMIVEDVIEKEYSRQTRRGSIICQSLKCRGCRRTDFVKMFSFKEAFEHVLDVHARVVGDGLEFWQFAVPYAREYETWLPGADDDRSIYQFPWYTVAWPRCLPLVPAHQDVSQLGNWHPAVSPPFSQIPEPDTVSVFEERLPRPTDIKPDDFPSNLVHAAKKLHGTWLDGHCQMKIAMKYALDLYWKTHQREPALSKFTGCFEELRSANPAINSRVRCGICVGESKPNRNGRYTKSTMSIETLLTHWEEKHEKDDIPWSKGLLQLPSEIEVTEQVSHVDDKLAAEKEAAQGRTVLSSTDLKKRPKLKGSLVLQTPLAKEVFDELFAYRHSVTRSLSEESKEPIEAEDQTLALGKQEENDEQLEPR